MSDIEENFKECVENEKRKHFNKSNQGALTWILSNLTDSSESKRYNYKDIYLFYLENLTSPLTIAINEQEFIKLINKTFPSGFDVLITSKFADAIKVQEINTKTDLVKNQKTIIDWSSIIRDALEKLGNPRKGIKFNSIKLLVSTLNPSLKLNFKFNKFLTIIQNEVYEKRLQCVKGVGAAGIYRLPRTAKEEADEIIAEKKAVVSKQLMKIAKLAGNNDEKINDDITVQTNNIKSNSKKLSEKEITETKVQKSKLNKKPSHEKMKLLEIIPLAMTYCVEPKIAGFSKIHRYISDCYNASLTEDQFEECLNDGIDNKIWVKKISRKFHLNISEFDPTDDADLTGMIVNAIVACTEPKKSSVLLIKQYISDYHPEYNINAKPKVLLQALERAVAKNLIMRISGIGMNGSYMLNTSYRPGPLVLQGFADNNDIEESYIPKPTKYKRAGHITTVNEDVRIDRKKKMAAIGTYSNYKRIRGIKARSVSAKRVSYNEDTEISSDEDVGTKLSESSTSKNPNMRKKRNVLVNSRSHNAAVSRSNREKNEESSKDDIFCSSNDETNDKDYEVRPHKKIQKTKVGQNTNKISGKTDSHKKRDESNVTRRLTSLRNQRKTYKTYLSDAADDDDDNNNNNNDGTKYDAKNNKSTIKRVFQSKVSIKKLPLDSELESGDDKATTYSHKILDKKRRRSNADLNIKNIQIEKSHQKDFSDKSEDEQSDLVINSRGNDSVASNDKLNSKHGQKRLSSKRENSLIKGIKLIHNGTLSFDSDVSMKNMNRAAIILKRVVVSK